MKTSRANLQPKATLSSPRSVSWQHRRDEGVRAAEQESVAGVVIVVVRRGVVTAGPHDGPGESLKLISRHMDRFTCLRVRRRRSLRLPRLASAAPEELRASRAADARREAWARWGRGPSWRRPQIGAATGRARAQEDSA